MFVDASNYQDAEKYFQGCYIKVKEYGDTLVRIDKVTQAALWGVDSYNENVCIELDGQATGTVGYQLDYVIPRKAYFQYGGCAYILGRIPARMWKKGINKQNTSVNALRFNGVFKHIDLDFTILNAYVQKPHYLSFTELKDNESIALSPRFALTKENQIFLDTVMIGKFFPQQKTVICRKLFMDDLKPLFPGVKIVKG